MSSHTLDSSREDEPLRMARLGLRIEATSIDFKVEMLEFDGKLDHEEFLDWLHTVERVFEYKDIPEDKKVKLVALRLHKYASLWCDQFLCQKSKGKEVQNKNLGEDEV